MQILQFALFICAIYYMVICYIGYWLHGLFQVYLIHRLFVIEVIGYIHEPFVTSIGWGVARIFDLGGRISAEV